MTFLTGSCAIVLSILANSPPSPPASSQPAGGDSKPRLAVLDFKVVGKVDASGSQAAGALVRREINASGKYDLMDREMMRERMAEKDLAAVVECDQVKCLVQYGKSLDVQKIVGGSLASFGDSWMVEIRLVDVNTGREEKTFAQKHAGKMDDVLDVVVDGARELIDLPRNWPARLPKTLMLDCGNGVKLELVSISPGTFTMGSSDGFFDEEPPHKVTISKPYYMGKFEVTQAQWQAVMGKNPSNFKGDANLPVESVQFNNCQEFCNRLSAKTGKVVRLPTEAEWEYACRAGSKAKFCFGDNDSDLDAYGWYESNSSKKTHPKGQKKANAWGLYDAHGNVHEFCQDGYDVYASGPQTDPLGGQTEENHVIRGGGFGIGPKECRSSSRGGTKPDQRGNNIGLRVLVEAQ